MEIGPRSIHTANSMSVVVVGMASCCVRRRPYRHIQHCTESPAWNGFIVIIYAENELCPATRARSAFLPY